MGLRDWRVRHSVKDSVRGEFQVTGRYFAHPNGNSFREMLTGVITGPGIPPTAGEHLDDTAGRYVGHDVLPALIDRTEPTRFIVLWDEIPKPDFRAEARAQAQQAARAAGLAAHGSESPSQSASIHAAAGTSDATPSWATDMIADLTRQGIIPGAPQASGPQPPIVINLADQIVDLTAGGISAGEAARLIADGEPATAILTAISDVPVPQEALPGPTASLCDLTLHVTRATGDSYPAKTRLGFKNAQRRALIAVVGATLPVRIDPHDSTRVVIDSDTYDAHHPDLTKRPPSS